MSSGEAPGPSNGIENPQKKRKADELEADCDESGKAMGGDGGGDKSKKAGVDDDDEEGMLCPICLEAWTSSGDHRIASLRCGHFFGFHCIEKWLKTGNDCPNCNDKASRKDIRPHYVWKLKAMDTGERDRALKELEETKKVLRALELDHASLKVTCQTRKEEIEKLQEQVRLLRSGIGLQIGVDVAGATAGPGPSTSAISPSCPSTYSRLLYVKRCELIRRDAPVPTSLDPQAAANRYCRVMAYNETHGMLVVSQPSFTALAPGYGVRRVNMLDCRVGSFVGLHKDAIRDLAVNPVYQDQLLSVSQDKTARLTNISTCAEIQRYTCESEIWSCAWNFDDPSIFYVGTKRSELFVYDTRSPGGQPKFQLQFPLVERRPIIGLCYVPRKVGHPSFPCSGLLVQTLGTVWFFEMLDTPSTLSTDNMSSTESSSEVSYKAHKLALNVLHWSIKFDVTTRLFLASTKPSPHSRHMVCELSRINVSENPSIPDFQISTNVIMDQTRGGSYSEKSFLRSAICPKPGVENGPVLVLYGRGSAHSDHKLIVQEVGNEKIIQEIPVERPIVDVCAFRLNAEHFVTVLCEAELYIYKWCS